MKKYVAILLLAIFTYAIASAQTDNNLGYTKTSAFIQYGYAPVNSFAFWGEGTFNPNYPGLTFGYSTESISSFGAVTAGASFSLSKLIELGIPLTYSRCSGHIIGDTDPTTYNTDITDNWYALTPNVKFNWYNSKSGSFRLYSRVGIGIALATRKTVTDAGVHLDSKASFAFIAAPIGFEVGKNISFFAEAGFGQTGAISAGVRFKFRKTKKGFNADGTAKEYNWTERYMDRK